MNKQLVAALMLTALVGGTAAQAQGRWDNHWNHRNNNNWGNNFNLSMFDQNWFTSMQNKINRGIQSGRLTPQESRRLQSRLNRIQNMQARMSRNGINPRERQELISQLQRENDLINQELHDGQFVGSTYFNRYRHY